MEDSNFAVEKGAKHHLSQMTKVNISSDTPYCYFVLLI